MLLDLIDASHRNKEILFKSDVQDLLRKFVIGQSTALLTSYSDSMSRRSTDTREKGVTEKMKTCALIRSIPLLDLLILIERCKLLQI